MPIAMLILFLILPLFPSRDILTAKHTFQEPASGSRIKGQNGVSEENISCEEMLAKAVSLNESVKNAVSAGGQQAFKLESENYYKTVLLKNISACVADTAARSDAHMARLLFELAYSYSNPANDAIALESARFYSKDPKTANTILLEYEKSKRQGLIEMLKWGLDNLYSKKPGEASRLKKLKQSLDELELK